MYAVTLISPPNSAGLDPVLTENLRTAWGGRNQNWLAAREVAEFEIPALPDNQWSTWEDLQKMQIDLVVQIRDGRKKSILLADMDSTMIEQECIDELAAEIGVGHQVAAITARAMNGELNFESALVERVRMLAGLDVRVVDTVLRDRITLTPGAKTLLDTMKSHGAYAVLVSGGFTNFSAKIGATLGFDENRANKLLEADGFLTGKVQFPVLGKDAKVTALQDTTGKLNLRPADVIAVGDGANDLGMLQIAGTGVALHAKPAVASQCDVRINHGDLTALLYLQGFRKDEFVN